MAINRQETDYTASPEKAAMIRAESIVRILGRLSEDFKRIDAKQGQTIASTLTAALNEAKSNIPTAAATDTAELAYYETEWGFVTLEHAERIGIPVEPTAG